jgi:hypothetical protein
MPTDWASRPAAGQDDQLRLFADETVSPLEAARGARPLLCTLSEMRRTIECDTCGTNELGSVTVQMLILLAVLALGGSVAVKRLNQAIREKSTCTAEAIASLTPGGGRCGQSASPPVDSRAIPDDGPADRGSSPPPSEGGPEQGPPITAGPIEVLPFPGSVSVSCSGGKNDDGKSCKGPGKTTGVTVTPSGTQTIERSPTKLSAKGCPQQTLSVSTTFKLEASRGKNSGGEKPTAKGKLKVFTAAQTKYSVTVSPDQAEAIEHGQRTLPNPLDPTSIGRGESIQMSEEFYASLGLSGEYRALQVDLGYDKGRRVSSGVTRLPDGKVRVYVGDEDFVRNALAFGVGGGGASLSVGFNKELSDGKLKAVDIDISTPEGWNAYQQFIATGHLPEDGAAGTSNPTQSTTTKLSDSAKLEAQLGQFKLGGQLKDAEGNLVDTRFADGHREQSFNIRFNDLGLEVTAEQDAKGNPIGERKYALNLEGVRPDVYSNFQKLNFNDPTPPPDGNVRWEFTGSDLMGIREQALNTIAAQMESEFGVHPRPSAQEVADILERNNGRIIYGPHDAEFFPHPPSVGLLANMRTPEEVLEALYRLGNGRPNDLLTGPLTDFILAVNRANGDTNPTERGRLPGRLRGPSGCGS